MAGYGIRDASTLVTAIGDYARYTENKRRYDQEYQDKKAREAKLDDRWERDYDMRRESHELGVKQSELNISELEKQIQDRADSKKLRQQRIDTLNATQQEATQVNTEPRQQITQALGLGNSGTGQGPMGFIDNGDGTQTPYITTQKGEAKPLNSVANDDKSPTIKGTPEAFDKLASNVEQAGIVRPDDSPEDAQAVVRNATEMDADGYITGNLNSPEAFAENIKQWGPKAQAPSELQPVESLQAKSLALDERIEYFRSKRDAEGQDGMSRDIYGQQYEDLLKEKAAIDKKVAINIDKNRQQPQAPLKNTRSFPEANKADPVVFDVNGVGTGLKKLGEGLTNLWNSIPSGAGVPPVVEKTVNVNDAGKAEVDPKASPKDVMEAWRLLDQHFGDNKPFKSTRSENYQITTGEVLQELPNNPSMRRVTPALRKAYGDLLVNGDIELKQYQNAMQTGFLEYNEVELAEKLMGLEIGKAQYAAHMQEATGLKQQIQLAKTEKELLKAYTNSAKDLVGNKAKELGKNSDEVRQLTGLFNGALDIMLASSGIDPSKLQDPAYRVAFSRAFEDWYRNEGHIKGDSPTAYFVTEFGSYRPQLISDIETISMNAQGRHSTTEIRKFYNDEFDALRRQYGGEIPEEHMPKALADAKAMAVERFGIAQ